MSTSLSDYAGFLQRQLERGETKAKLWITGRWLIRTEKLPRETVERLLGPEPQEPSKVQLVTNFVKSVTKAALNGFPQVDQQTRAGRLSLCQSCEHFNAEKETCRKCGCNLALKTSWKLEKCPVGKW